MGEAGPGRSKARTLDSTTWDKTTLGVRCLDPLWRRPYSSDHRRNTRAAIVGSEHAAPGIARILAAIRGGAPRNKGDSRRSEAAPAFVGIHNENEFYSHHYLSEIFTRDIADTTGAWRKDAANGDKPPYDQLRALAGEFHRRRGDFQRERSPESRLKLQRAWLQTLLRPFGHGWKPGDHLLDDGNPFPALAADGFRDGSAQLFVLDALDTENDGDDPLTLHPHRPSSTARLRRPRNCSTPPGTTSSRASSDGNSRRAGCCCSPSTASC